MPMIEMEIAVFGLSIDISERRSNGLCMMNVLSAMITVQVIVVWSNTKLLQIILRCLNVLFLDTLEKDMLQG